MADFRAIIKKGNLETIKKTIIENNISSEILLNSGALIIAAECGHLDILKFLHTLLGANNNTWITEAIFDAVKNNHIKTFKYLLPFLTVVSADPSALKIAYGLFMFYSREKNHFDLFKFIINNLDVDIMYDNNLLLKYAIGDNQVEIVELLLDIPKVRDSFDFSYLMVYKPKHKEVMAMLLYCEPGFKKAIVDVESFSLIHKNLLSELRPVAYKITVSLVELPTPIIIEIIEQSMDFAIYIPYHIKWNMVVAIKHCKLNKKIQEDVVDDATSAMKTLKH